MKNLLRRVSIFLGLLLVIAVLAIVPELIGDETEAGVKGLTGEMWFLPVVVGLGIVALLISVFWTEGDKIFNRSKKIPIEGEVEDGLFQEARDGQRKAFEDRSNKKLAGRDFIDLEVSYTVEGSNALAPLLNKGVEEGEKEQDLLKVFEAASGRLLIIGLPGSGKTTLLLQLAISLLDRVEEQVPVVLDIATWQARFKTIEDWAVELLPDMGFNKRLAQQLIDEKKLLPLFDGLDELGEESRAGFLAAVEKYAAESANKFVITSRKAEYAATIDAAVEYQVVVNPFTLFQIREALHKKSSPESMAMLDRIDKDEHFAEAIKTPFYLNAVQLLFSHKNLSQKLVFEADDLKGRQGEVEVAFVEHALGGLEGYSKQDGRKWLAFLADRMSRRGLVRFELVDMQYDWSVLDKPTLGIARYFIAVNWSLYAGLVLYVVLMLLIFVLTFTQIAFLQFVKICVTSFLIFLLISTVLGLYIMKDIKTPTIILLGKINATWEDGWGLLMKAYNQAIKWGVGIVGLLILFDLFGDSQIENLRRNISTGMRVVFIVMIVNFLYDLILTKSSHFLRIKTPYQRFYASITLGNFSIFQHWHLCYLLRKRGLAPRRYPDFLSAATKQSILESDGGSWRFRHRILQEYFVGVWEEAHGSDEALKDGWKPED